MEGMLVPARRSGGEKGWGPGGRTGEGGVRNVVEPAQSFPAKGGAALADVYPLPQTPLLARYE